MVRIQRFYKYRYITGNFYFERVEVLEGKIGKTENYRFQESKLDTALPETGPQKL